MSQKREAFMMMGKWGPTRVLTFLLVSLLVPALAWSQVLTLTPSLTIGERYDDNIFQDDNNEEDDFITTISPAIQLRYIPRPESALTLEYQPSFEIFADHGSENHVSHRLNLNVASPLSRRFSLEVNEQLLITEDPSDRDRDGVVGDGERDRADSNERRQRSIRNAADLSLDIGLTPRTSLSLLFENLIEDVQDNDELDEFRYVIGSEVGYITNVARQNRAALTYRATFFTFSQNCSVQEANANPRVCTPQNDESFTVHTFTGGYEHNLSATLKAQASVGYATTVSDNDEVDGNNALVGSIGFAKTLRTGQLAFSYERSFTSGNGTADEVVSNRFFANLTFRPSPKVTAGITGSLSLLNFTEDGSTATQDDDRAFYTIRPSVTYQILRFLTLKASYDLAVSNFREGARADRTDHRFSAGAVFAIRAGLFIDLSYQYRTRNFDSTGVESSAGFDPSTQEDREDGEFTRNEVILSVTYRPTFRF